MNEKKAEICYCTDTELTGKHYTDDHEAKECQENHPNPDCN